jgi:integrase
VPGRYGDGAGLYLQVGPTGTKSWLLRYMLNGRSREMGLGPVPLISLAEARVRATACRKQLIDGLDPLDQKAAQKLARALEVAKAITFDECAAAYIEAHRPGWKNIKHAGQWESTLKTYASPLIGGLAVQAVDTSLLLKILTPIWRDKTETAVRLRNRIELVLSWAGARGYRTGENPARWRGHLDKLLPKPTKVKAVVHHPALPIDELPAFLKKLRAEGSTACLALEFLILTAARTGEVLGAHWNEFNLPEASWTIPGNRMKAGKEHRVPLTPRVMEILRIMQARPAGGMVFPGRNRGSGLSNMALLAILRRMNCGVTSHGFRSTFRDWASERTNFSREVAEAALAHTLRDKVEAAYRRGDLFLKRRRLMEAWAQFCNSPASEVAPVYDLRPPILESFP